MHRPLRPLAATVLVALASASTLAASVVATKAYALLLGPDGVGLYALMLSVLNLGVLGLGLGLPVSAARRVAAVLGIRSAYPAKGRAGVALLVAVAAGVTGGLVIVLLREPLASIALGQASDARHILILAPAVILGTVSSVGIAILTGFRQLKTVAMTNVASAVVSAALGIALVAVIGMEGLAWALLSAAAVQAILTGAAIWMGRLTAKHPHLVAEGGRLIVEGVPVMLTQAITTATLLVVPLIVLAILGSEAVGYYRAAAAVSIGIGSLFVTGIHQDFLPSIAAESARAERVRLIDERMRVVLGLALPAILVLLAGAPLVIDILYSAEFRPAIVVLQWQLVGDVARLPAIILVTAALGIGSRRTVLLIESASGATLVVATVIAMEMLGLVGAGIGYAVAQSVALLVAWLAIRFTVGAAPGRLQVSLFALLAILAALLIVEVGDQVRSMVLLAAALGVAAAVRSWFRRFGFRSA